MKALIAIALTMAGAPVWAQTGFVTARYICDRDVEVPATYINPEDQQFVVIHVDGEQITLLSEVSGSGARYGWPSDGANYVWWTKGKEATLYWREADKETPVLSCVEVE